MKDFQEVRAEKVIANLGGTSFLTETGKVIEGNYKVGDYAPVIYNRTSLRFLPAWKKELSGKEIRIEEDVEPIFRVMESWVGVLVSATIYNLQGVGLIIRVLFENTDEQNVENKYVDIISDEINLTLYKLRLIRVLDDRPDLGIIVLSPIDDLSLFSPPNIYHYVVKFKLGDKVKPVETYQGYVKYEVDFVVIQLPAAWQDNQLPVFSITFSHPNRVIVNEDAWKFVYREKTEFCGGGWVDSCYIENGVVWPETQAERDPLTYLSETNIQKPNPYTQEVGQCIRVWYGSGSRPPYCPNIHPYIYAVKHVNYDIDIIEHEPKNEADLPDYDYFYKNYSRIVVIGAKVWLEGEEKTLNNLKYRIAGEIETFWRVRVRETITRWRELLSGGCPEWWTTDYLSESGIGKAMYLTFYLTEAEDDQWGSLEDIIGFGGEVLILGMMMYDYYKRKFLPDAYIWYWLAIPKFEYRWDEIDFDDVGNWERYEFVYNIKECFYLDDGKRVVVFSTIEKVLDFDENYIYEYEILYYKIGNDEPVEIKRNYLGRINYYEWVNYYVQKGWRDVYGCQGTLRSLGEGGSSPDSKRVMFKSLAYSSHYYLINRNSYHSISGSDWEPIIPPMEGDDFKNSIGPLAREIWTLPMNIAGIDVSSSNYYGKFYNEKKKEVESLQGFAPCGGNNSPQKGFGTGSGVSTFCVSLEKWRIPGQ